jgi:hypothetical protein
MIDFSDLFIPNINPEESGMLIRQAHGGDCCGMTHIHNFPYKPNAEVQKELDNIVESITEACAQEGCSCGCSAASPGRGLVEIVLVDAQAKGWHSSLKKRGFRRVGRFLNSNSGNYCNIYHLAFGQPRGGSREKDPIDD